MNRLFKKVPLLVKLLLIGLIPFGFLLYAVMQIYHDKTEKLELFQNYKAYMEESANISSLISSLQEERKYSFDYAITGSAWQQLVLQRPKTDSLIGLLQQSGDASISDFTTYTKLKNLAATRKRVDTMGIRPDEIMHFYSNTVFRLNTLNTIPPANTAYLQPVYSDLMAQKILSEMITYLGIIRSNIYNVLHTRQYMVETLMGTYGAYDVFKSYEEELLAKATPAVVSQYKNVKQASAYSPTITYIDTLFKHFSFNDSYTAAEWWQVSDKGSDALSALQGRIWSDLNQKVNTLYNGELQARNRIVTFLVLALLCVIIIVAYTVFIISRTLASLRRAAEKIAKGETGVSVEVETNDAIGSLAASISAIDASNISLAKAAHQIGKGDFAVEIPLRSQNDSLGNALLAMKSELQQYRYQMEQLVHERTEELARSNDDLQQFAHVASHDLKEPLRKISTYSDMLTNEQASLSDRGKLYLEKIHVASRRMSHMIEGVLTYSTLAARQQKFEPVSLDKIMEGVESDLELAIVQKEAHIRHGSLPQVNGISLLLHQLFYNLVNNSLKFSREGVSPVIAISTEATSTPANGKQNKFVHIVVKDNGIGFNPVFSEKIFKVFSRLHTKDKYEGTGLGLALCRKIVERHKGKIYAEANEGEGAAFHIWLPGT